MVKKIKVSYYNGEVYRIILINLIMVNIKDDVILIVYIVDKI